MVLMRKSGSDVMVTLNSRSVTSRSGVDIANKVLRDYGIELVTSQMNRQLAVMNEFATLRVMHDGEMVCEAGTGEAVIEKLGELLPNADLRKRRVLVTEDYGREVLEVIFADGGGKA
ncbi:hypothetical protein KS4_20820 [Poriferisphaera corsica]|uniref:Uncharacterized protein n=1 Tax=Poriferisphaera corsica TaxID=2528020 RepID=A0A517YUX8_9BACT|nr:hypothetical protein [Poriferisphaera corsica]QDU34021.1 hypothetical protein KS4_20820 [Poriferisphaera corsica]